MMPSLEHHQLCMYIYTVAAYAVCPASFRGLCISMILSWASACYCHGFSLVWGKGPPHLIGFGVWHLLHLWKCRVSSFMLLPAAWHQRRSRQPSDTGTMSSVRGSGSKSIRYPLHDNPFAQAQIYASLKVQDDKVALRLHCHT